MKLYVKKIKAIAVIWLAKNVPSATPNTSRLKDKTSKELKMIFRADKQITKKLEIFVFCMPK